jgi:hypothetical protein
MRNRLLPNPAHSSKERRSRRVQTYCDGDDQKNGSQYYEDDRAHNHIHDSLGNQRVRFEHPAADLVPCIDENVGKRACEQYGDAVSGEQDSKSRCDPFGMSPQSAGTPVAEWASSRSADLAQL